MTTFMSPPPVVTCLAFHPEDNNIVAVGFDDSTIHIYNVRIDEVFCFVLLYANFCIRTYLKEIYN